MGFHHFPANLKRYREARGFSQEALAGILQLGSRQVLSSWERGETEPSMDLIVRTAEALDVSVESHFGDANNSRVVSFHNLGIGGAGCSLGVGLVAHYLAAHHKMLVICVNAKECNYATRALELGLRRDDDYRANGSINDIPIRKGADGVDSVLCETLEQLRGAMGSSEAARYVVSTAKESGYDFVLVDSDRIGFEKGGEFARLADDLVLFSSRNENNARLASSQFGKLSHVRKIWNVFPLSDYRFGWEGLDVGYYTGIRNFNVLQVDGVIPYNEYINEIGSGIGQRLIYDDPRAKNFCDYYRKFSDSLVDVAQ